MTAIEMFLRDLREFERKAIAERMQRSSSEGRHPMTQSYIPGYVDPDVLVPGTTVVGVLDANQTRLVVLRVEPMLICRAPDGHEVTVFAHEVVVEQLPATCEDCGATLVETDINPDGSAHYCLATLP